MARPIRRLSKLSLELTPLLDIVFILLIFFAVSTSVEVHKSNINLTLPQAESGEKDVEGIILSIDDTHTIRLNEKVTPLPNLRMEATLLAKTNPDQIVVIQAHKTTSYDLIIKVMDKLRLSGLLNVTLEVENPK
jgi:biopolymer transport protein ExbD